MPLYLSVRLCMKSVQDISISAIAVNAVKRNNRRVTAVGENHVGQRSGFWAPLSDSMGPPFSTPRRHPSLAGVFSSREHKSSAMDEEEYTYDRFEDGTSSTSPAPALPLSPAMAVHSTLLHSLFSSSPCLAVDCTRDCTLLSASSASPLPMAFPIPRRPPLHSPSPAPFPS